MNRKASVTRSSSIPKLSLPRASNSSIGITPGSSRINKVIPKYRIPESVQKPQKAQNGATKRSRSSADRISRISLATAGKITPNKFLTPGQNNQLLTVSKVSRASTDTLRSSYGGRSSTYSWPLDDRTFKSSCVAKVLDFLNENNFDLPLSANMLRSPSKKDFATIFSFIYKHVNPRFRASNLDDEIPVILPKLKYCIKMKKSSFLNVGSSFTWPSVLAMLAWLVDCLNLHMIINPEMTSHQKEFPDEVNMSENKFLSFINIFHSADEEEEEMHLLTYENAVEVFHQVTEQDRQCLQEEQDVYIRELEKMGDSKQILASLQQQFEQMKLDQEKLSKFNSDMNQYITGMDQERAKVYENLEELQEQHQQMVEQIEKLKAKKESQDLSVLDLQQMKNSAKETAEQLSNLQEEKKQLTEQVWSLELETSKTVKSLSDSSTTFNTLCFDFNLVDCQISTSNLRNVMPSWEGAVLPVAMAQKKKVKDEAFDVQNGLLYLRKENEKLKEVIKEKESQRHKLDGKIKRGGEDVQCLKQEMFQTEKDLQSEYERLEGLLTQARGAPKDSLYERHSSLEELKERLKTLKKQNKEKMEKGQQFFVALVQSGRKIVKEREGLISEHQESMNSYTAKHLQACTSIMDSMKK